MGGPAIINDRPYYEFDNFNMKYPFMYDDKKWYSCEQLYQAMKFDDEEYREYIRAQRDSHCIYMLGQDRTKMGVYSQQMDPTGTMTSLFNNVLLF